MALIVHDVSLEDESGWKVVNQPDVNDPLADSYVLIDTPTGLRSYIAGCAYSGACGSLTRRTMDGFHHPSMSFEVCPDDCVAINAQALEFDLRIQLGEWNYNFSGQLNLAKGGMWQLVNAEEHWVDTEFIPGLLPADVWTAVNLSYELNLDAHAFSTTRVIIGERIWEVPEKYRHVPASRKNWENGTATIQVQIGLNHMGGACSHKIRDLTIAWE